MTIPSILSSSGRRALAEFIRSDVLVAFDYDGTLAPIAATPGGARMPKATRDLLRRLAMRYPCVVISGRQYDDIAFRLRGVPLRQVFGNHGIEPLWVRRGGVAVVRRWASELRDRLGDLPGIVIEDKRHSLAIHCRHARNQRRTGGLLTDAIADLKGARVIRGRRAVDIMPERGANKGVALRRACRLIGCRRAIYVGDDGTDEDAFGALPRGRLLGIRVGRRPDSLARYVLTRQRDVDGLLRVLLTLQAPVQPHRR